MFKHKSNSFHQNTLDTSKPSITAKRHSEVFQQNPELLSKLYQTNRMLELNVLKVAEQERQLREKDEQIDELRQTLKQVRDSESKLKCEVKALKNDIKHKPKQRNSEQSLIDYQSLMLQNQAYQQQIIDLQNEINNISHRLHASEEAMAMIKETECKVNYLEMDLDRLEERNKITPLLAEQHQNELQIIGQGAEYLQKSFIKSAQTLSRQLKILGKNHRLIPSELRFLEFYELQSQTINKSVHLILKKINLDTTIQIWLEAIINFVIGNVQEIISKFVLAHIDRLNKKISILEQLIIRLSMKRDFNSKKDRYSNKNSLDPYFSNFSRCKTAEKENYQINGVLQSVQELIELSLNKLNGQQQVIQKLVVDFDSPSLCNRPFRDLHYGIRQLLGQQEELQCYFQQEFILLKKELQQMGKQQRFIQTPKTYI